MKKTIILAALVICTVMLGVGTGHAQPMGPGMMGPGYGPQSQENWNYCPYCGNYLGRGWGYHMGPGMMGRGYGPGYGGQYGPQYQQPSKPLDKDEAKQEVQDYLKSTRNPNLKIGSVEEKGDRYEVTVETKDGALVDRIMVDKETGWMSSAY